MSLIELAIPSRFVALSARLMPRLIAVTALVFLIGGIQAYLAPDDYQQGATVKIMFIHVPAAWLGTFAWVVMMAPSAGRCCRQGGGADGGRLHAHLSTYGIALGTTDVGHLLGVGCPPHLDAGAVHHVSRPDRAVAHRR